MRRIILSTESGADLPEELVEKHAVQVVPMHIIMDGKDYLDGSLPVEDIYAYHERTNQIPSTTATNVHEYIHFFNRIREDYPNCEIIHIGYTSKASSSFHNAMIAAEGFDNIILIDALNVTGGLAAIVMYAVQELEREPMIESEHLANKIKAIVPKSRLAFVPGSLAFLKAGGRVSNIAYLGGALLKIKPCIELIEGKLVSTKKYRGKMSVVTEKILQTYFNQYNLDKQQLYLLFSKGLDEKIMDRMTEIAKESGFINIKWIQAGAMITTHAGPGGFGVAGIEK
ncbi:DegV family EDD domain-containing protein [Oceanobacillus piezotolerans]|uniref:DegV family EDD domain-containing protein n=1 Tax=Oceanobacillus piezotolerans TaxID=2448030 RepID=A0A498DGF6_9BACI|nr:DegV family protein [Oceanobacillus piezotolerans]RLL43722.1 DegV family EDD domain-containing protein [Oceanobacillus piezotolerans]